MARGSSVDSSVVVRPVFTGSLATRRDSQDCSASPSSADHPVLAVACVPEQALTTLVDWVRSRRMPCLLCFTAVDAVRLLQQKAIGLMVLGDPPDAPVSETMRALRRLDSQTPILYVPASAGDRRQVSGPPPGANGLLVAPFTPLEVGETLERLWRAAPGPRDVLAAGPICLRLGLRLLTVDGVDANLNGKRLDLIAYLMKSANRVVPKEELALAVVGSLRGDPRRIAKDVCAVRAALGRAAVMLETCRGGYRFNSFGAHPIGGSTVRLTKSEPVPLN